MFKKDDKVLTDLFYKAQTRQDLADLLEIEDKSLRYFLFSVKPENLYKPFTLPKRRGGTRQIFAPVKKWRNVQRKLSYVLNLVYCPKTCSFGFVKEKNILGNASKHVKRSEILNIDLKDFFTQFHFGRVVGMLKAKPYSLGNEAATTIAQIACLNGVLPQGAPTSPILTNMLCAPLDNKLMRYAQKHHLVYTRYADDITFSSFGIGILDNIVFANDNKWQLAESLLTIFKECNLHINDEKISLRTKRQRQEVTGVIVNRFPNVKREYYKNVRALLYNCEKNGIYAEGIKYIEKGYCKSKRIAQSKDDASKRELIEDWYKRVLIGKIHYIKQIKGAQSFSFYNLALAANKVFFEEIFDLSYFDQINDIIDTNVFVLQNADETVQGSGFYVPDYGLFTAFHVTEDDDDYYLWRNGEKYSNTLISAQMNQMYADKTIDYALYNIPVLDAKKLSIGNSSDLEIGDSVIIAGFPDYMKGDTITKEKCEITGKTTLFGSLFYKVSGRVVHGASGGVVLDKNYNVVGIIKGGTPLDEKDYSTSKQGFVPIDLVIQDIEKKKSI